MRAAVLAILLGAVALPAAAAPVTVDLRVRATTGPLAGAVIRGSFTFDSASLVDGEGIDVPLTAVGGDFATYVADSAPVGLPFILLDGRSVTDFIFGGAPSGFDTVSAGGATPDFLADPVGFVYALPGDSFLYEGVIEYVQAPAPAALALLGLGAAALVARRRRA